MSGRLRSSKQGWGVRSIGVVVLQHNLNSMQGTMSLVLDAEQARRRMLAGKTTAMQQQCQGQINLSTSNIRMPVGGMTANCSIEGERDFRTGAPYGLRCCPA